MWSRVCACGVFMCVHAVCWGGGGYRGDRGLDGQHFGKAVVAQRGKRNCICDRFALIESPGQLRGNDIILFSSLDLV